MEFWEKMQRVWTGVAKRLRIHKSGLPKLRQDVRTCEYEDVHVMWEMLNRNETELAESSSGTNSKRRPLWNFREWTRRAPYLCRSF